MQTEQLYRVALATLCAIGAVLALTLIARGLFSGAQHLIAMASGG